VSEIFGFDERRFRGLKARFVPDTEMDAYDILGVTPDTPMDEVRKVWRQAVRESHPDQMIARGVPEEAIKLAEARMVAINRAWEEISAKGA
jgi:DnaJ like chaperone protein